MKSITYLVLIFSLSQTLHIFCKLLVLQKLFSAEKVQQTITHQSSLNKLYGNSLHSIDVVVSNVRKNKTRGWSSPLLMIMTEFRAVAIRINILLGLKWKKRCNIKGYFLNLLNSISLYIIYLVNK